MNLDPVSAVAQEAAKAAAQFALSAWVQGMLRGSSNQTAEDRARAWEKAGFEFGYKIYLLRQRLARLGRNEDLTCQTRARGLSWVGVSAVALCGGAVGLGLAAALPAPVSQRAFNLMTNTYTISPLPTESRLTDTCYTLKPNEFGRALNLAVSMGKHAGAELVECEVYAPVVHYKEKYSADLAELVKDDLNQRTFLATPAGADALSAEMREQLGELIKLTADGRDAEAWDYLEFLRHARVYEGYRPVADTLGQLYERVRLMDLNRYSEAELPLIADELVAGVDFDRLQLSFRDAMFITWALRDVAAREAQASGHRFMLQTLIHHGVSAADPEGALGQNRDDTRKFLLNAYRADPTLFDEVHRAVDQLVADDQRRDAPRQTASRQPSLAL